MHLSILYRHPIIRAKAVINLKNSLGKHVDLEGQPYNHIEQFNVIDTGTFPDNFVINSW